MHAKVGDRIVVGGHRASQPDRRCIVLGVRHDSGEPLYLVRWEDSGHDGLCFPGTDATVVGHEKK